MADARHAASHVHARQHRRVRHGVHRVSVWRRCVRARRGAAASPAAPICVVRAAEPCGDDEGSGRARPGGLVLSGGTGMRPGIPLGAALASLGDWCCRHCTPIAAMVHLDVLRARVALCASVRAGRQSVLHHTAAVVFEPRLQSHALRVDVFRRIFPMEHRRARRRTRHDSTLARGDQGSARKRFCCGRGSASCSSSSAWRASRSIGTSIRPHRRVACWLHVRG